MLFVIRIGQSITYFKSNGGFIIKQLTQNEIYRTAFKRIDNWDKKNSQFFLNKNRNPNEMCPYCKNEDADVVIDKTDLNRFENFYKDKYNFKVMHCSYCEAVFSFYWDK